ENAIEAALLKREEVIFRTGILAGAFLRVVPHANAVTATTINGPHRGFGNLRIANLAGVVEIRAHQRKYVGFIVRWKNGCSRVIAGHLIAPIFKIAAANESKH